MLGLVTQTLSGEVAVIDLRAQVVDVDPSTPGFSFLPVGAQPVDVVSTPDGVASFVGVSELGKPGIFALPTTCLGPPRKRPDGSLEPVRDITSFPACALPAAPGDMAVLIDPPLADSSVRATCSGTLFDPLVPPLAAQRELCAADLTSPALEPPGRRKLAVALPDLGLIAILDAQELLDRPLGSFAPCNVEAWVRLGTALPSTVEQPLPEDLWERTPAGVPLKRTATYTLNAGGASARPAGFGLMEDHGLLYVADQGAPVIHVLDVSDPCAPLEREPLFPVSLGSRDRLVTTTRLAVSPVAPNRFGQRGIALGLTPPNGKRFLYAIDEFDQPGASVMIFDVSPCNHDEGCQDRALGRPDLGQCINDDGTAYAGEMGKGRCSSARTPLVMAGSPAVPGRSSDRISFGSAVRDVAFALHDLPLSDPTTGTTTTGVFCNPDPSLPADEPGALHRPSTASPVGAGPGLLRGVFGFVLLTSGQVVVIDTDDYDAACRRPVETNHAKIEDFPDPLQVEDFRGCHDDPSEIQYYTLDGTPGGTSTVSGEVSCRVFEPHRARARDFIGISSSLGIHAPALATFPRLSSLDGGLPTDQSRDGKLHPKLLPVDFSNPEPTVESPILPAQVFIGTTLYKNQPNAAAPLLTDPAQADRLGLTLPMHTPRAYAFDEDVGAIYEGPLFGSRASGYLQVQDGSPYFLRDDSTPFCTLGVQDQKRTRELGEKQFSLTPGAPGDPLETFALRHADYVQILADFLPEEDSYWKSGVGASCGGGGLTACKTAFGAADQTHLEPLRDLAILEATQIELTVEPRYTSDPEQAKSVMQLLRCCFPTAVSYTVRAGRQWLVRGAGSGFRHDIMPDANGSCVHDLSPLRRFSKGRAFEISSRTCLAEPGTTPDCAVGPAAPEDVVCTYDPAIGAVSPVTEAAACIFESTTARFAIYRGQEPSERDMSFQWQTIGAFRPLSMTLGQGASVLPRSMSYLSELGMLAVVDGASLGLSLLSLDSLGVVEPSPFL
jgi:hypothetical protein